MSSEIYEFDGCFFNDPFSPSAMDILQEHNYSYTPLLPPSPPLTTQDQIATTLLSSSPPSHQLQNLSLYQMDINSAANDDFCSLEVKTEAFYDANCYYGGSDNALQRSYSSNSFQQGKSNSNSNSNGLLYQPAFDHSPANLHSQLLNNCFSSTHMIRRACSTGNLQSPKVNQTSQRLSSSALATESSSMEDANFKVGRYNAEERKEKILRYRAKRTQRNFNKTIKYACRKTLAENRPRIRGRFARNEEPGEMPKATTFHRDGDEEELWMDIGFQEDDDERLIGRGRGLIFNTYPSAGQLQPFSFIHN